MSERLAEVADIASSCLETIRDQFRPPVKITLLVRRVEHPDGSQDFILTDDDLTEAINAIEQRKHQGTTP